MSEEGPEPEELLEQAEESRDHVEHAGGGEHAVDGQERKRFAMRSAITASALAVGAALVSLLSGHAANEAILKTVEASDKWSYYQAKSTKEHIFEGNRQLLIALAGKAAATAQSKEAQAEFQKKFDKYDKEKEDIRKEAVKLQQQSTQEFERHQKMSLAVACFQIGIIFASVSILVNSKWLYIESIGAGIVGIAFAVWGMFST